MDIKNKILEILPSVFPEPDNKFTFKYPIPSVKERDMCRRLEIGEQTIVYSYYNVGNCVYSAVTVEGIVFGYDIASFFGSSIGAKRIFIPWLDIIKVEYSVEKKDFYFYLDGEYYRRGRFDFLGEFLSADKCCLIADKLMECASMFNDVDTLSHVFNEVCDRGDFDEADRIANEIVNGSATISANKEIGYYCKARAVNIKLIAVGRESDECSKMSDNIKKKQLDDEYKKLEKEALMYLELSYQNSEDAKFKSCLRMLMADVSGSVNARRFSIDAMSIESNFTEALERYRENTDIHFKLIEEKGFAEVIKGNNVSPEIYIVKDDMHLKGCFDETGEVCNVYTIDRLPNGINFQPGHPISNTLYIPHPCDESHYIAYESANKVLFLDKIREFCYLVQCLGATNVVFKSINGMKITSEMADSLDVSADLNVKVSSANASFLSKSDRNENHQHFDGVDIVQSFSPNRAPYVPEGLVWYNHEFSWQQLAKQRIEGNILHYEIKMSSHDATSISSSQETRIKCGYKNIIMGVNLNYGTSYSEKLNTESDNEWNIIVDFQSNEPIRPKDTDNAHGEKRETEYHAKMGECSYVSLGDVSYNYDAGSDVVTLRCSKIANESDSRTGNLKIILWVSEKKYGNNGWRNSNHQIIQEVHLGSLDIDQYIYDLEHDFVAENFLNDIIKSHYLDLDLPWCFVFTLNELHDDGSWYIVYVVNGQIENEKLILPIADKSVSLIANRSFNGNVKTFSAFSGDKPFMGSLYSKDELFEIQFYNSEFPAVTCYHDNGKVAVEMEYGSDEETLYYNEDGKEINENEFKSMYGGKFEKVLSNAFDELMKKSMSN